MSVLATQPGSAAYYLSEFRIELIIIALALCVYAACCVYAIAPWKKRAQAKALAENPPSLVGYKRAVLTLRDKPFMGVFEDSAPYSIVDVAAPKTPGFHAYYSLDKALSHPQPGNLYLEVLGNGRVEHHELGMTTQRQNVLQVMVGDCTVCTENQAVQWVQIKDVFNFVCADCAHHYTHAAPLEELEAKLAAYCLPGEASPVVSTLKPSSLGRAFTPSSVTRND